MPDLRVWEPAFDEAAHPLPVASGTKKPGISATINAYWNRRGLQ